jgi:ParB/RepB/Spo0J family partition protein
MPRRQRKDQLGLGDEFDLQLLDEIGVPAPPPAEYRQADPRTLRSSPFQPRQNFDEDGIAELAASIRLHGLLQPLLVRTTQAGLELLAGERRKRAAVQAGLEKVPIRVLAVDNDSAAAIALAENLHRQNLSAWEEAQGIAQLRDVLTREGKRPNRDRLAQVSGRSTGWVSESLFIAERITGEVVAMAGVDRQSVTALPQTALLGIARAEDDAARARLLALAVHSAAPGRAVELEQQKGRRGRPAKPYSLRIHRKGDRAGQVAFAIRNPAEITADTARKILNDLQPVLDSLRERAGLDSE